MTTTKTIDEELDVLSSEPAWPEALTDTAPAGPPPPPAARRARGTAPFGEPITSGLIDMREMAAAYAEGRRDAEESQRELASGTRPIELVALATELAPLLEPDTGTDLPPPSPSRRRTAMAVVAIGGALVAAAFIAGSLLARDGRTSPAPAPAAPHVLEAPPLVIHASDVVEPEVKVIPLPTTITEVAPRPRTRRPAARRPAPRAAR